MTYNKPENITYVEMCIYFDEHIYSEDRDDNILYQYLYHIIYMLACKKRYFNTWEEYDLFALYMATKVYLRYINPNHQEAEDRIKSVLNYCKNLLYPTKVDFQKETYAEIFGSDPNRDDDFFSLKSDMVENVQVSHTDTELLMEDLVSEFKALSKIIWKEINKTPYVNDKILCRRLFMSVLVTVVKGLTLSNAVKDKLQKKALKGSDTEALVLESLTKERESSTTLWRLGSEYTDIVSMLAFKVRKRCGENINLVRKEFELSDEDVNAVLASAYGNVLRDDNEEF